VDFRFIFPVYLREHFPYKPKGEGAQRAQMFPFQVFSFPFLLALIKTLISFYAAAGNHPL
jgi:hypothetical protein